MYTSMKSMLLHAHENNYAVMAVNCVNMEIVKAIVGAAVEENSAVIINISPRQFKAHAALELLTPMIMQYANSVHVPIALNLDHGQEYQDIHHAIAVGFSSVMLDGSALAYEENIRRTRLISLIAHEQNCSVEAELGHVGAAKDGDGMKSDYFTVPEQAVDFVEKTNVECLAVAFGTAHGNYPAGMIPTLDFERLAQLKKALDMPLVMHGGSGAGEANIKRSVELGINKINVCTDLFNYGRDAMVKALEKNPNIDYMDVQHVGELAMKDYIKSYMRMIGSSGRYQYSAVSGKKFD